MGKFYLQLNCLSTQSPVSWLYFMSNINGIIYFHSLCFLYTRNTKFNFMVYNQQLCRKFSYLNFLLRLLLASSKYTEFFHSNNLIYKLHMLYKPF